MEIKEIHKKIIRDTFFCLFAVTIFVALYQHFFHSYFLYLQTNLVIVTLVFGIVWIYLSFIFGKKIRISIKKNENVKKKLIIFLIGFVFYSLFLNLIYTHFSFNRFLFFLLILYIPISYILELDPRIPILIALVLLVSCGFSLTQELKVYADNLSVYAYYFFVIGLVLLFIDYLRELKKNDYLFFNRHDNNE
jgi:hypothetical protein